MGRKKPITEYDKTKKHDTITLSHSRVSPRTSEGGGGGDDTGDDGDAQMLAACLNDDAGRLETVLEFLGGNFASDAFSHLRASWSAFVCDAGDDAVVAVALAVLWDVGC